MTAPTDRRNGPLVLPVTPRDDQERLDPDALRRHAGDGIAAGRGAVFACRGTGGSPSPSPEERTACAAAAVRERAGRTPVAAGTGYVTRPSGPRERAPEVIDR